MIQITSTTFTLNGLTIMNAYYTDSAAMDMFIISAMLNSNVYISNLKISNVTNPIAFLLSSDLTLVNSSISNVNLQSSA